MNNQALSVVDDGYFSIEIKSLLNPAFCAYVLYEFIKGYQTIDSRGAQYPLIFFVLPIVLQKVIRQKMNGTNASTGLNKWLVDNSEVRIELVQIISGMNYFTKKSLLFGLQSQIISMQNNKIVVGNNKKIKQPQGWIDERGDIIKKSTLLGKWFAQMEDSATIFTMFGVRI
jgi:hypothetical protein